MAAVPAEGLFVSIGLRLCMGTIAKLGGVQCVVSCAKRTAEVTYVQHNPRNEQRISLAQRDDDDVHGAFYVCCCFR